VNWSSYRPISSGGTVAATARFIQYEAIFESGEDSVTATLFDIAFNWE
jgi:hypothetical protein